MFSNPQPEFKTEESNDTFWTDDSEYLSAINRQPTTNQDYLHSFSTTRLNQNNDLKINSEETPKMVVSDVKEILSSFEQKINLKYDDLKPRAFNSRMSEPAIDLRDNLNRQSTFNSNESKPRLSNPFASFNGGLVNPEDRIGQIDASNLTGLNHENNIQSIPIKEDNQGFNSNSNEKLVIENIDDEENDVGSDRKVISTDDYQLRSIWEDNDGKIELRNSKNDVNDSNKLKSNANESSKRTDVADYENYIRGNKTKSKYEPIDETADKDKGKLNRFKQSFKENSQFDVKKLKEVFSNDDQNTNNLKRNDKNNSATTIVKNYHNYNINDSYLGTVESTTRLKVLVGVLTSCLLILPVITTLSTVYALQMTTPIYSLTTTTTTTTSTMTTSQQQILSKATTTKIVKTNATGGNGSGGRRYSLYDLFMATNISSINITNFTNTTSYVGSYNVSNAYGISYMNINGTVTYYVIENNSSLNMLVLNENFTLIKSKPMTYGMQVGCNNRTEEIYVTQSGFDFFKLNSSLNETYGLGNCSASNCSFEGLFYDYSNDTLYVANSQNNSIHVYDSNNYTSYGNLALNGSTPHALYKYNDLLYVASNNNVTIMYTNGTVVNQTSTVCNNTTPITCMYIDEYGFIALPCSGNSSFIDLYYSNMTFAARILTGQVPYCLTYDIYGRLLVTDTDGIKIFWK